MTKLERLMMKDFEWHLTKVENGWVRHCEGCGYLLDTTEKHIKLCIHCWSGGPKREVSNANSTL